MNLIFSTLQAGDDKNLLKVVLSLLVHVQFHTLKTHDTVRIMISKSIKLRIYTLALSIKISAEIAIKIYVKTHYCKY